MEDNCQRDFIIETHPVKTQRWNNLHLIKYCIGDSIEFQEM